MGDAFEAKFMAGDAQVRHRDKRVSRLMTAVLASPALIALGVGALLVFGGPGDKPLPPGAMPLVVAGLVAYAAMFLFLALTFAVLRTVVTDRELVVKYGLWGPTIALDRIKSARVTDYAWTKFGGWGIRHGVGGVWAYVPGPGKVVEVVYGDEDGTEKRVLVGAADPAALAQQIQAARTARTTLRLEDGAADADGLEDLEAEREAAEAEAHERRASSNARRHPRPER